MITKNLFKLGSLLLVLLVVLSFDAVGQQRTWYVNNQIGSDGYDGLAATVTPPSSGPKRTIDAAITEGNDGDIIVVAYTGVEYGTGTGEPAGGLAPGNKILTFQSSGGTPKVSVAFGVNNTAVTTANTKAVEFGGPIWFASGFSLQRGGVVGASNMTVTGTLTRFAYAGTDPAFDSAPTYSGGVNLVYESGVPSAEITSGNEFAASGISALSVAPGGTVSNIALTISGAKTIDGVLTTADGSTINLGGAVFTLSKAGAHNVSGDITNGTLAFSMNAATSVTGAALVDLPSITAVETTTGGQTLTLTNIATTKALSASSKASITATLTGGTSASAAAVTGNVTNSGSGTITLDHASSTLFVTGDVSLSGTGSIAFPGTGATAFTVTGNVMLSSAIAFSSSGATASKGQITFGDDPTIVTGSTTNSVVFSGSTDDPTNDNNGVIIYGAANNNVSVGAVTNNANLGYTLLDATTDGTAAGNGDIRFAFVGGGANTFKAGAVLNSVTVTSQAINANQTNNGRIVFTGPPSDPVEVGAVTNSTSYSSSSVNGTNGTIDLGGASSANFKAASVLSTGGYGGDIQLGAGNLNVTGNLTNERSQTGADILVGSAGGAGKTVAIGGNLVNSGKAAITFNVTVDASVTVTGTVQSTGSGTGCIIDWPNATNTAPFTFGGLTVSGGKVMLDGTGAITSTITTKAINLTGGEIDLGTGVRIWDLTGPTHTIGGTSGNPTFTTGSGASTTLRYPSPAPTVLVVTTLGPLEPSYPGPLSITNAGGLSEAVKFTGGNLRVGGDVTFNTGSTASTVVFDGAKLYITGASSTFTNTTGYTTMNNGFVSMNGATQNVGGLGTFGDFEVNVTTSATAANALTMTGTVYLTTGQLINAGPNTVTMDNATVTPTIVRNEGTFFAAPQIATGSMVNVVYIGRDKASSNELPVATDKLNNLTVATTNGGNGAGTVTDGKGAAARGVVTLTADATVNGKLTVSQYQTLAIAQNIKIDMKGATMQVDGQIVNLEAADFVASQDILILSRTGGTTIMGAGLLPPILVSSSGNMIDGSKGIIDVQMGANFTDGAGATGTDDVIDGDPSAANGTIQFANAAATLTVKMASGAGANGTHLGFITTANSGNVLTLGANLMVESNLNHVAGSIDVASFTLTFRGAAHSVTGGATIVGTGLLKFHTLAATTFTVNTGAATIAANTEVSVNAAAANFTLVTGGQNLIVEGTLTVSKASAVAAGVGIEIGDGRTLTAAGSSLTMGSGTSIFASPPAALGTGILKLDAVTPPLTFNASGAVTIANLTVSDDVVLALTGTTPSVTVTAAFLHDGGNLNFGAYDLTISGTYTKSGTTSAYTATDGYLIINTTTFNQGANAFSIPNLRFTANATQTIASQTGVVTVTGKLDVQATPDISNANTNSTTILAVGDAATVNYRSGGFDVDPTFGATMTLVVDQAANGTVMDANVWPSTPATLVTTFRVANANAVDVIEIPGNRQVNTALELRTGVLDLGTAADRTLTVVNGATIKRRSSASVVLNGGSLTFGGNDMLVVYEANAAMTTGVELPATVKDLTFTRSSNVANATTTINSSVTISGLLWIRNDINIGALTNVTALGDVKVELDAAFTNATAPAFGGAGSITLGGSTDQTITVPSTGSSIGSITINKASSANKVTIAGGSLTCTGTVTFIKGLVYTGADNALVLNGNAVGFVLTGFVRNVAAGEKSHVVGNVSVPLKGGAIIAFGRNEFPVGDATYYRPATITIVNPAAGNIAIGINAMIKYENTRPTGIVGLPIPNGVSTGVDIARYPEFSWFIKTTGSLGQTQFNLELTAEGYSDFDDVANVRLIRRSGTVADVTNTWSLQGVQYDNYVIGGVPTVVNVNSTGGLIPGGATYTYGLKSTMVVANVIADQNLSDASPSFTRNLLSPALFTGAKGAISYTAVAANPAVVTVAVANNVLTVTRKVSGTTTVTVTGTDAFDGSRINFTFTVTSVSNVEVANDIVPTEFSMAQNYPNPFNPSTTIRFGLPKEAPVTLEIYNLLGMKVRTLMSGREMGAAFYNITWDGRDDAGVSLPSGIYIYRIVADKFVSSKKMTLVK